MGTALPFLDFFLLIFQLPSPAIELEVSAAAQKNQ
jgi:hypothetical protein